MTSPQDYLNLALELAYQGLGHTWPNPMVGAILVKNGKIIGQGFHQRYGGPHAEVVAIQNATDDVAGATLYCTLEPCSHEKKQTPPCAKLLIEKKIKHVVVICEDPNSQVSGNGLAQLRTAGITIEVIPHRLEEYQKLNAPFWKMMQKKMPYVHLKWAQTLDGKMARVNGHSKWITGELARAHGHFLRGTHQAILVGASTLINDDPELSVRYQWESKLPQPLRVIVQGQRPLPESAKVFAPSPQKTLIIRPTGTTPLSKKYAHIDVLELDADHNNQVDPEELLQALFERKIISVFVEGGPKLLASFINLDLADEASIFIAPKIFGEGLAPGDSLVFSSLQECIQLEQTSCTTLGPDILLNGLLTRR